MDTFASSTAASLPLLHSNPWSNSKRSAPEEADTSRINTGAEPDMDSSSSSSRTPLVWRLHYNEFMKHMHGRLHAVVRGLKEGVMCRAAQTLYICCI
jgi:hypothetical protein